MLRPLSTLPLLGLALIGCTPTQSLLDDPSFATGSRTLVTDSAHQVLYNVNVDEGTVSRTHVDGGVDRVHVGAEPTRIARAGQRLFVSLRADRAVAVLQDTPAGLQVVDTLPLGAEPYGVVADEAGSVVYVAISLEDRVVALDAATGETLRSWTLPGQPSWLALHPGGRTLAVVGSRGGSLHTVQVDAGQDGVTPVPLPLTERTTYQGVVQLTGRLMGDPAFDAAGLNLVIPALYVDNHSLQDVPAGLDPTTAYYANPAPGLGRFNAALLQIPADRDGAVDIDRSRPVFLSGVAADPYYGTSIVRSYPNSVSIAPDGRTYAASMEASDAVLMVGALDYDRGARVSGMWMAPAEADDPTRHGFQDHPHATVQVGHGPRGVAFDPRGDAWVHTFMDLRVAAIDMKPVQKTIRARGVSGLTDDDSFDNAAAAAFEVETSSLPDAVRRGRALFYSATRSDLVAQNSGVSCSTCHVDGRDDGLSWQLGPNLRQTPSLAGRVSDTHPVTWTNDVADVATEAQLTSTIRMGGFQASDADYQDMAAFIDWGREVDHPARDGEDPQVAIGRALFEREDVGCASCHTGVAYTDNLHHDMFGLSRVNTPTLRGIAATAPYLHDGRAETLRDVLEMSRNGSMGNTSMLDEAQMSALEAYVRSL